MGDCHLNYRSHRCEDRFCKYSYVSWCPNCDRSSPKRRLKSDPNDCRKKCKEMKCFSPRKYPRQYDNMDLECESSGFWYDPKENYYPSSQLCELPTSYITNNCQTSKLSTSESDSEKNASNSYDPALKMKQEDFMESFRMERPKNVNGFGRRPVRDAAPQYYSNLNFDTGTCFDKIRNAENLQEKYAKEIESVREKIAAYKNSCKRLEESRSQVKSISITQPKFHEQYEKGVAAMRDKLDSYAKSKGDAGDLGAKLKRVTVKTKAKSGSAKSRRARMSASRGPFVVNPSKTCAESECSDDSDSEEINAEDESESVSDEVQGQEKEKEKVASPQSGAGDTLGWPVRASLFPNVPPYILFSPHDAQVAVKVPACRHLFKWKLSTITPIVVRNTLSNTGFAMVRKSNQWLGTWGKHMKSPMFKTLKDTQKLNHFPGTFQLGRKDRLWRNFQKLINRHGYKEFGFIPQTFVLPQELRLLKQNWEYRNGSGSETWIIKPPASARGVGIRVINKWSQLPKKMSLVVQRYISNPYLINGSKFDLRLYVLVTSFCPLRIYLYPEGLARFASAKYSDDTKDLKDRYVHLTNYSINKLSSQYTANEDANACQGHKWTLTKLFEYMEKDGVDTKSLWKKLQQLVIKTIITGEAPIRSLCEENMLSRYNCYELFGVDVLLDEQLKPWLLEVNISPSLHSASPLDTHVKGPLVQTLFDLAQFHFPPRLAQSARQTPQCYDSRLYTTTLTKKERHKHELYLQYEKRSEYIEDILTELTGDDVRRLTQAEDEFTVMGRFERIFPTSQTYKYLDFMEPRYYNRLFDAWEANYETDRSSGIERLRSLCAEKVHLKVAPHSTLDKNSPSTTPVVQNLQPSKGGYSRPLTEVMQEVTITSSPSCN